jgi:hypothetical protein
MTGLPRQSVWIAAALIVALSAFGAYEGLQKASSPVTADDLPVPLSGAPAKPAPGAATKTATALPEPVAPTVAALSESQIRSIVRQEVQAVLTKGEPEAAPLALQPPTTLSTPPTIVRGPSDARSDAELLSGAGGPANR